MCLHFEKVKMIYENIFSLKTLAMHLLNSITFCQEQELIMVKKECLFLLTLNLKIHTKGRWHLGQWCSES